MRQYVIKKNDGSSEFALNFSATPLSENLCKCNIEMEEELSIIERISSLINAILHYGKNIKPIVHYQFSDLTGCIDIDISFKYNFRGICRDAIIDSFGESIQNAFANFNSIVIESMDATRKKKKTLVHIRLRILRKLTIPSLHILADLINYSIEGPEEPIILPDTHMIKVKRIKYLEGKAAK